MFSLIKTQYMAFEITILPLTICDQNFIHSMNTRIMQLRKFKKI